MKAKIIIAILLMAMSSCFSQEVKKIKITELEKIIRESRGPLIVNFWATFCIPCIEEIPYFQRKVKEHVKDSIKLLLVSLDLNEDYPKIKPFLIKKKITARAAWLDETNADYFCPKVDSAWSGAIPATLFINNKTGYRKFLEEKIKEESFERQITAMLAKQY